MISIIPYFAGFITVLFSLGFYFALRDARENRGNAEQRLKQK